jgi:hypothetical protein
MNLRVFGALTSVLFLGACAGFNPGQPNVCQVAVPSWGGCSNQDEHSAKSAPGGNPAPAVAAKPEPPKVEPEPPTKPEKPGKPGRPGRPGHDHNDRDHEGRGSGTPDGRNEPGWR